MGYVGVELRGKPDADEPEAGGIEGWAQQATMRMRGSRFCEEKRINWVRSEGITISLTSGSHLTRLYSPAPWTVLTESHRQ
jgi:hypothetical protein